MFDIHDRVGYLAKHPEQLARVLHGQQHRERCKCGRWAPWGEDECRKCEKVRIRRLKRGSGRNRGGV